MSEKKPSPGQLRLIRDLHVDRRLGALDAEQAAPILAGAGLLTPERLDTVPGIRRDGDGRLLGDGRQLAFRLSRTEGIDRDLISDVYARLAEQFHVEFTAPASYELADRQIARLKSIVRDQTQVRREASSGIETTERDVIADLDHESHEDERARASYAPDTVENIPSRPDAEQAGISASWGAGHQMAQQHVHGRASA